MSTLLGQPHPVGTDPVPPAAPSLVGAAALAAAQAAAASLVLVGVPVVVTWIVTAGGSTTWTQVVRLWLAIWLLAQRGGLVVSGGHVGLAPLGLTVLSLLTCLLSGRRLARVLDPRAERIASGARGAAPTLPPLRALVVFVAGYAALGGLAALLAARPGMRPVLPQAVLGPGVVAAVGGGLGVAAYASGGLRHALARARSRLPVWLERLVGPALWALAGQLLAATVLLLARIAANWDRVLGLHRALHPDLAGGIVLVVGQAALLPNAVLWVASVAAGPGFVLGTGTSITSSTAVLGPLPAVPLLGALPAPGRLPAEAGLVLLVPVLAGALAGGRLRRGGDTGWLRVLADVTGTGVLAGLCFALLAWLSGGPAGPGRLAATGPVPWLVGAAFAAEVAGSALALIVLSRGTRAALERWRNPGPEPFEDED